MVLVLDSVTLSLLFVTQLPRLVFPGRFNGNLGQHCGDVLVLSYADECENTSQMILGSGIIKIAFEFALTRKAWTKFEVNV